MFQDLFVDTADNGFAFNLRNARDKNSSSAFNCSYASSVLNKIRNPLTVCGIHLPLRIPLTFCRIHFQLRNPEQLAIFACCGIRDTTNVPTQITLHSYVRGIHGKFVSEIHLLFGTCKKISFWNPATYRHKIERLCSAQFGLVRKTSFFYAQLVPIARSLDK